jgi:lactoylglutathione lyase
MDLVGQKIELFVSDLAQSAEFYRRVLGFEVGPTREVVFDGQLLRHTPVLNGPIMIGLGRIAFLSPTHHLRRAGLEAARGVGVEFCLYVNTGDIEDYYVRAARECTTKIEPLVVQPWGARDFRVVDPDGYYVRISTPDKDYRPLSVKHS